jgi:hypothetical protein
MSVVFAVAAACMLLTVPVKDCDPVAQQWLPDVQRLPSAHWAMLDQFIVGDGDNAGRTEWNQDGHTMMTLDPNATMRTLEHELGHVVGRSIKVDGQWLDELYRDKFWQDGKAQGSTTRYGRTNYHEDFAECYKLVLRYGDECGRGRMRFIIRYAFNGQQPPKTT